MRPKTVLRTLFVAPALVLAACGGTTATDVDHDELLQNGEFAKAVSVIEGRLESVEAGSEDQKELMISYAHALSESSPDRAKDEFLKFAESNADMLKPNDYRFVVEQLRTYEHYMAAIDVMDAGKTRWPEDATIKAVIDVLVADVKASGDDAAKGKMSGLGYF